MKQNLLKLSLLFVLVLAFSRDLMAQRSDSISKKTIKDKSSIWEVEPFLDAAQIISYNLAKKRVVFAQDNSRQSDKTGMADLNGDLTLNPVFSAIEDRDSIFYLLKNFRECYAKEGKWNECISLPYKWEHASYLRTYEEESQKSGLRFIRVAQKKYRIETLSGKFIVDLYADEPPRFTNKFIFYRQNNKMGMLDKQGKERIPLKYTYISDFSNGHSAVAKIGYGDGGFLIDTLGRIFFEPKDSMTLNIWAKNSSSFLLQKKNSELQGIVDEWGQIIVQPFARFIILANKLYAYSNDLQEKWYVNALATQQPLLGGKGFLNIDFFKDTIITIDSEKNLVEVFTIESKKFLEIKNGQWGAYGAYIQQKGGHQFLRVNEHRGGQKYYYLDGRSVFDRGSIKELVDLGFIVEVNEKYGLIGFNGEVLIPFSLDALTYLDNSKSLWGKVGNKWGMLQIK